MDKRLLSLIVCVALLVAMIPASVFAETTYDVWVCGTQVTETNKGDVLSDGGKVQYDPTSNTLTISDSLTLTATTTCAAIQCGYSDKFTVIAPNGITLTGNNNGIKAQGALDIKGNIILDDIRTGIFALFTDITGSVTGSAQHRAISATKLTVSGDIDVYLTVNDSNTQNVIDSATSVYIGGDAILSGASLNKDAIKASGDITIGGNVDISGLNDIGLYALNGGSITVNGNFEGTAQRYVLNAGKDVIIGGDLVASAEDTINPCCAVAADNSMTFGGSVDITSEHTGLQIGPGAGPIAFSGGDVLIIADDAAIETNGDVVISGSCAVDINSFDNTAVVCNNLSFNGTGSPLSFYTFTTTAAAISAGSIGGTNFANYRLTGDPASDSAVYNYQVPVVYYDPSYSVVCEDATHGTVTASPGSAESGTTVTLTVKPDKGYTLETLTVVDRNGKEIEITPQKYGETYTFRMPSGKVTVKATFMEDNTMLNYFIDVKADDWFYDQVLWAAENGVTHGTDSLHFSPYATCTRAQMITMLWNAAGQPVVNYALPFADVKADSFYTEAVRWAASLGITSGKTANSFGPDDPITREQLAVLIYNYAKTKGQGFTGSWMFLLNYADRAEVSSWADEAMHWCVMNGIIKGYNDNTLGPGKTANRAEIVSMLYSYFNE